MLIDGKRVSRKIDSQLESRIKNVKTHNIYPYLAVIIVGSNPQSKIYIKMKKKRCEKLGVKCDIIELSSLSTTADVKLKIQELNNNTDVHGILVQLPLPNHICTATIINTISPAKDVDGFHTSSIGNLALNINSAIVPCTPLGCLKLIDEYNIDLKGKDVVVIGKSNIVGLPLSLLLMHREATVTVCHILTKNLEEKTRSADIIFVGCGVPNLITVDHIKEGAIIVDIGINKIRENSETKIVGDVDFNSCKEKASMITPVPGGVGPMTISMLISNLVDIAEKQI